MDDDLIEAYRRTLYCVRFDDDEEKCLKIGERSAWLDREFQAAGQHLAIFITAENPRSKRLDKAANGERTHALRDWLTAAGYRFLEGYGAAQNSDWPPEASFLVLGATREAGRDLAGRFDQNAFVFAEQGEIVELVFVEP